jgi:DNA-binding NarL/FixJ family response regulator
LLLCHDAPQGHLPWWSICMWSELNRPLTLADILTGKQLRIVELVASGLKNKDIADAVGTTEYVIKNYMREIFDKCGCWNRVELALRHVHETEGGPSLERYLNN